MVCRRNTPAPHADGSFHAGSLDVYFNSKRAGVAGQLVARLTDFIAATEKSLDCAIYDLRNPDVVEPLKRVHGAGRKLRIAFDGGPKRTGGRSQPGRRR